MVWLNIENVGFIKIGAISYIGEVDLIDFDDFSHKNLYGFELIVDGELFPLVYNSKDKALKVHSELKKQLLMSARILKLEV